MGPARSPGGTELPSRWRALSPRASLSTRSPFFGPGFARAAGGASGELSFSGRGLMDEGDINAVPSNVTESTGPSVSLTAVVMTWAVLCVLGLLFIAWVSCPPPCARAPPRSRLRDSDDNVRSVNTRKEPALPRRTALPARGQPGGPFDRLPGVRRRSPLSLPAVPSGGPVRRGRVHGAGQADDDPGSDAGWRRATTDHQGRPARRHQGVVAGRGHAVFTGLSRPPWMDAGARTALRKAPGQAIPGRRGGPRRVHDAFAPRHSARSRLYML